MNNYIYIFIIIAVVLMILSFMFSVGWWLIPALIVLYYISKIIRGFLHKDEEKTSYTNEQENYDDDSSNSYYESSSDVIDADYTVVEEEKTN